jgi:hypothetical protein
VRATESSGGRGAREGKADRERRALAYGMQSAEMRRWRRMGPIAFRDRRWGVVCKAAKELRVSLGFVSVGGLRLGLVSSGWVIWAWPVGWHLPF